MSLILDGTNGVSDIDGTAATPAIRGTDTNTGIFFPAVDTIAFAEGGTEVARFDSSGNLGVGTSTPSSFYSLADNLVLGNGTGGHGLTIYSGSDSSGYIGFNDTASNGMQGFIQYNHSGDYMAFAPNGAERMRIDSGGNLNIGTTSTLGKVTVFWDSNAQQGITLRTTSGTFNGGPIQFLNNSGVQAGAITQTASSVSYTTGSDYRLKENIAPMTGALATVQQLKPVTYNWKVDGSSSQGFIAHELQAVVPDCVSGEKDAVDAEGNPQYQGIDTSFLVATLTAAIQELKAELDSVKAELATLKGAA